MRQPRVMAEAPPVVAASASTAGKSARTRWLAEAEADHGRHDTPAESSGARARRRSCGHEGVTPADRGAAMEPGRARTAFGRVARDTTIRRSLRSLRPCPATGPARLQATARRAEPRIRH